MKDYDDWIKLTKNKQYSNSNKNEKYRE
jgi:hypothetical protein